VLNETKSQKMGGLSSLQNHKELVHNNFNVDVVGRLLDKAHQNPQKKHCLVHYM
jgi:hypothetical protein